jgi:nucleotide-binding universal stress UspA family protein
MKVLLPIDNSECSQSTLRWATRFLDRETVQIHLLDVLLYTDCIPVTDYETEEARRVLEEAKEFLVKHGFDVQKITSLTGNPVQDICDYADDNKIDQILMGSHCRHGVAKLLMGSVSEKVFKQAKQPVLIISHDSDAILKSNCFENSCLREHCKNKENQPMKILIPVDGSDCCKAALYWASKFLVKTRDSIYLLNVIYFTPEALVSDEEIEEGTKMLNKAKAFFEEEGFKVIKAEYVLGEPPHEICDYADTRKIDQIIMGSHGRQGLAKFIMGSVSESVFKHANQPVLVVNTGPQSSLSISHPEKVIFSQ